LERRAKITTAQLKDMKRADRADQRVESQQAFIKLIEGLVPDLAEKVFGDARGVILVKIKQ